MRKKKIITFAFASVGNINHYPLYMKARIIIGVVALIGLIAISCKKDINPVVIYTVEDSTGARLENARIFTHPCFDGVSCDTTRLNGDFIKQGLTNSNGQLTYEYPFSAIIDVIGNYTNCDTAKGIWCMYSGRTVARFETKRTSKNVDNEYNVKIVLYLEN